jgi:protein-S-isoprenylcysteine O-methyltransferase Ste14
MFWLFIIWVAIILMQIRRIRNEEKVLAEKFGDEYLEYKKGTWF